MAERLTAMHRARDASVKAQRTSGTALIVTKHRVVEEAFRETDVRLVSMQAIGRRPLASAYHDGKRAGDRVNLNRPVTGATPGLLG